MKCSAERWIAIQNDRISQATCPKKVWSAANPIRSPRFFIPGLIAPIVLFDRGAVSLAATGGQSLFFFRVQRLPQIWRESFFHCGYGFASPGRVINCLIASDLPDSEIFRIRMRKIEPAHAGAGMHRKRLRQFHPCVVLCIEQIKERSFLGVIWTGWITGSGPDAAIFFTDQIGIRQLFVAPKSPRDASFFMKIFGKRFS